MTEELRDALHWWLENRPLKDKQHVFLCLDNTPLCREQYGEPFKYRLQFMRRLCKRAGVKPFGFHAIRHLSASILYKLGDEVAVIQAILRHRSSRTTELYLKSLGLEKVRDALEGLSQQKRQPLPFRQGQVDEKGTGFENRKPSGEPSSLQTA